MRRIEYGSAFKKDYNRMVKSGLRVEKLETVLSLLVSDTLLPARNRPHMLSGEWRGVLGMPHRTRLASHL